MCKEVGILGELAERSFVIGSYVRKPRYTNQPNRNAAPQETRVFVDRPFDAGRCCGVSRSIEIDSQEETSEDVVMGRTEPNIQMCERPTGILPTF